MPLQKAKDVNFLSPIAEKKKKVAVLWSGGKDSALACHKAIEAGYDVVFILTFIWEKPSLAHSLDLVKLQSKALQIPFFWAKVTQPYFESYRETIAELKEDFGITALVTGDISYVDRFHGNWVDDVCKGLGVEVIKPLWEQDRSLILQELISNGFSVVFSCAKQPWLDASWIGVKLSPQTFKNLQELNEKFRMDMCGEMGEYHTMTLDGPLFKCTIQISGYEANKVGNSFIMNQIQSTLIAK